VVSGHGQWSVVSGQWSVVSERNQKPGQLQQGNGNPELAMMLLCPGSGKFHANGRRESRKWIQELSDEMSAERLDGFWIGWDERQAREQREQWFSFAIFDLNIGSTDKEIVNL
jgi:hypothetical protein